MYVQLDGRDVHLDAEPGALAGDLSPGGYWVDGRHVGPHQALDLYEGAVVTTEPPPRAPAATAEVLDVVGGLWAGRSHPLPRRAVVAGRAPDCDIVLDDPTVSPYHVRIDEDRRVHDLGSVNGTWTDGELICLGTTQMRVRPAREDTSRPGPHHRPPRVPAPSAGEPPQPPGPLPSAARAGGRAGLGPALTAAAGPALMGIAMLAVSRDPRYVAFAVIGPLLGTAAWASTNRTNRARRRAHRRALAAFEHDLAAYRVRERQHLEQVVPDLCVMTRHLWARRPGDDDFGLVRLGLRGSTPVVLDARAGPIGICGDRDASLAVARSIVCQLAVHHGPADVRINVTGPAGAGGVWEWTKWLPHRAQVDVEFRVAVADSADGLPAACGSVVWVDETGCSGDVVVCGMQEQAARDLARWLARFEDPEAPAATSLPAEVRLSEVEGIAIGPDGPVDIDLVRDGPHALIAGTTGSGKSELLRTLVARLASRHTPAEMVFVLIDYKGGAAFDECARLPHCVGHVTDLDEHLGARALRSLEAELRHRERAARRSAEAEPRLVVVIDEFATLANELPEFLGALVDIAQRGRSLGMHLVLATQRPSGVVNAHIKANTNLRIALRVQDAADSVDVVDGPEAAAIDRGTPGRAYLRRGSGDVVAVQTAISSRPARLDRPPVLVRPDDRVCTSPQPEPAAEHSELQVLVEQLRAGWDGPVPRRPWLPMLPAHLDLDAIDASGFALADEPDHQRQVPVVWDPRLGNLLLFGMAGSGTSTALHAAVARLPADATVYALDFGFGAAERHGRLLRLLRRTLDERRATGVNGPPVVTCIDGAGTLLAEHDGIDGVEVLDSFHRLFTEGPPYGISFVVTADRLSALPLRLRAAVADKLLFRLADPQDYAEIGLRPRDVPPLVPGRAIHADGNRIVQVGVPAAERAEGPRPRTVRLLPDRIDIRDLPPGAVGIDDDLEPVWLGEVEHLLVIGPRRSGKTTALRTFASVLRYHHVIDDALAADAIDAAAGPVLAATRPDDLRGAYRHWLHDLRRARTGLLLQPDLAADGDLLGVRLPRRTCTPMRVGRGFLVLDGEARLVQVAEVGDVTRAG